MFCYADNTCIVFESRTIRKLEQKIRDDLRMIAGWFKFHKVCPNFDKTNAINNQYRTLRNTNIEIIWNEVKINMADETKFLGVILKNNLNWNGHNIEYLQAKLRKKNLVLYLAKKNLPLKYRFMVYEAFNELVLELNAGEVVQSTL